MMQIPEHIPTISQQTRLFLGSCLLGVPIGLLLDCFRVLRALLPHHTIAVFLEDTLFSCIAIFLIQCYAAMFAHGILRMYFLVGALLGLTLYLLTIGNIIMRITRKLRKFIEYIHHFIKRFLRKMKSIFVKAYENQKNA